MRTFWMICVLLSSLCSLCEAQPKMRDVFLQMPDSLLPYLTENNRLDFIDFIDSGMKAVVNNELGGKSEMLSLTDESLVLQVSPAMKVKMQMMPVSQPVDSCSQVICMITTCGVSAPESRIDIFSVHWTPVNVSAHLTLPHEPYVADFVEIPSKGLKLQQSIALDYPATEEQEKGVSLLKNVEWKQ